MAVHDRRSLPTYGVRQESNRSVDRICTTRPNAKQLGVSCGEGEASPTEFYEKLGFKRTGEKEGEEILLRLELAGE